AWREFSGSRYRHPFTHAFRKPERIDARSQFRSGLDCEDFDVGLDRLHQILDALERSRDRTRATAARPLVMHGKPVAFEAEDVQIAAVTLQIGTDVLIEQRIDHIEALLVFGTQVGDRGGRRCYRGGSLCTRRGRGTEWLRNLSRQLLPVSAAVLRNREP